MRKFRPFGTHCPMPAKSIFTKVCDGILSHEDYPGWVYIECPKCKTRWVKDWPQGRHK